MDDPAAAEPERFEMPLGTTPIPSTGEDFGIDAELIKVLASDSRRDILRLLHQRRMTLTELSGALDLKKATVLEHLKRLTDAGLARRLDEDRLWVYYELTGRGKRVVNPGRTRFYLMMGVSALALLLAAGALAMIAMNARHEGPSPSTSPLVDAPGWNGAGWDSSGWDAAPAGAPVSLELRGEAAEPGARAYLLTDEDLARLKEDKGVVGGIPLALAQSQNGVARYQTFSAVPAGTYYVYVVDAQGRDNLDDIASVRIPSLDVSGPAVAWKGFDEGATFRVMRDGAPANGSLLLAAGEGQELPVLAIVDGVATLDQDTLDRLVPANYSIQYLPQGDRWWLTVGTFLDVREPLAAPSPAVVAEGKVVPVSLYLAPPSWGEPASLPLFVDGDAPPTRLEGRALAFDLAAREPGTVELQLGRDLHRAIDVRPDARFAFASDADGLSLSLSLPNGTPLGGALVQVDGKDRGTTDANGTLALGDVETGARRFTVYANTQPFRVLSRAAFVEGWNVTAAEPGVKVVAVDASAPDGRVQATATLESRGVAPEVGTLTLRVDNAPVAWAVVDLGPLGNATRTLEAPFRAPPGDHAVSVGFAPIARAPITFANRTSGNATPAVSGAALDDRGGETTTNATSVRVAGETTSDLYKVVVTPSAGEVTYSPPTTPSPAAQASPTAPAKAPGPGVGLALAAVGVALLLRRRLNRS